MMKLSHMAAVGFMSAVMSGCTVLPDPAPANTIYRLSEMPEPVMANTEAFVVRVDRPQASIVFQSRDIVVSPDGQKLASAAQAKWAEAMPVLIQQAFIDVMESRPNLVGVMPASGARTDTRLQITVKNFEAQFDRGPNAAPLAVVDFTVTFANASNRNFLGTYNVKKTHRAEAASVPAIVNAISKANVSVLSDIADWLERQPAHQSSAS
jgi:cholesterol transport system auxiliary component